jgi:large subunit ribosomal protein L1
LHVNVGKASFDEKKIYDNVKAFIDTVVRLKPSSAKGTYLKSITISSTMGPGIPIDRNLVLTEARA